LPGVIADRGRGRLNRPAPCHFQRKSSSEVSAPPDRDGLWWSWEPPEGHGDNVSLAMGASTPDQLLTCYSLLSWLQPRCVSCGESRHHVAFDQQQLPRLQTHQIVGAETPAFRHGEEAPISSLDKSSHLPSGVAGNIGCERLAPYQHPS